MKQCPYCSGQGYYITHTWGQEKKNECRGCGGTGEVKDNDKKETM